MQGVQIMNHQKRHHAVSAPEPFEEEEFMAKCEVCGNEYDKSFEVVAAGARHVFDSFECAIQAMAPICEHCGCKVIGHGVEVGGRFYCCAHCARINTSADVKDRAA